MGEGINRTGRIRMNGGSNFHILGHGECRGVIVQVFCTLLWSTVGVQIISGRDSVRECENRTKSSSSMMTMNSIFLA